MRHPDVEQVRRMEDAEREREVQLMQQNLERERELERNEVLTRQMEERQRYEEDMRRQNRER